MRATYKHNHPLCKTGKGHPQVRYSTHLPPPHHYSTPPRRDPLFLLSWFLRLRPFTTISSNQRLPKSLLAASVPPTGTHLPILSGHLPTHLTRSRRGNHTPFGPSPTALRMAYSSSGRIQTVLLTRWTGCSLPTCCVISARCMRGRWA
jgi:hypothetical protein